MTEKIFPAKIEELSAVLGFVEETLEQHQCQMKMQTAICVAIEEVFVNVAHYAYGDADGDVSLGICFEESNREVTFRMADKGIPFNPLEKPDPDITLSAEEREIGGLGIFITKKTMDQVTYAYENGQTDIEAREKMANAATMAGMSFANAFLGICHSMAHKLGAFHHLPHGVANALMIEEVIRFNACEAPAKMGTFSQYDHPHTLARYAEIADYLGLGGTTDTEKLENLIKAINDLKAKVGIKETIKDYGIDEKVFLDNLDEMVEQAFDDQCTGANPRYPLMSEIKEMYLRAYYGK